MTRNTSVCASEDDGTDTGSMISMDDTPSTPVARGVKRSSQEITAPIAPVDEAPALARCVWPSPQHPARPPFACVCGRDAGAGVGA